ncbi:MAG: site-specific DNA-methyltransferase [Ignavibacteriales bacterium]|nr:site-specific DNA-methyltransferase [Ignavibacteriales bacterium]
MKYQLLLGDAYEQLRRMKSRSVQCVVTSPPYWGLRDYGVDGQLGQESSPKEFVSKLVAIFSEVKRVLKDDGTLWLNLGDTYVGSNQSAGQKVSTLSTVQKGNRGSLHSIKRIPVNYKVLGLKPKDLIGIPWSVAFALRDAGWYLRSDIIWYKTNPMVESVRDRPTKAHEYIFLLTKRKKYYYDQEAIAEPIKPESLKRGKRGASFHRYSALMGHTQKGTAKWADKNPTTRNKRSVWIISLKHSKFEHYATFPEDIPMICIKAGTKKGDVVLDPFAGSGTTLVAALKLRRKAIGIDINKKYVNRIMRPRLEKLLKAA